MWAESKKANLGGRSGRCGEKEGISGRVVGVGPVIGRGAVSSRADFSAREGGILRFLPGPGAPITPARSRTRPPALFSSELIPPHQRV